MEILTKILLSTVVGFLLLAIAVRVIAKISIKTFFELKKEEQKKEKSK